MRILHTADWHLGNSMHEVDRTQEQEKFLKWLTKIIIDEKIETLIVAGDIFDVFSPSNWATKLFYRFLASLLNTECRNVVVVGGNHDSGNFLDAPGDLFDALNIHVVGNAENRDIEDMVFELKDDKGNTAAICAAVPFVSEIYLEDFCDGSDACPDKCFSDMTYSRLYKTFLEKALELKKDKDIPLIATGHLYAAGLEGRYEGLEDEVKTDDGIRQLDVVGNLGKVHVNSFPDEFDYVALGHIHYHTRVDKRDKIRYSGSPFVMGFDETETKHYVLRVDLGEENNPHALSVKPIEVPRSIYFKRLSGSPDNIKSDLNEVILKATSTTEFEQYCLELYYKAEDSKAVHALEKDIGLPENVRIVSWKVDVPENDYKTKLKSQDMRSLENLDSKTIIRELVLSHIRIERGDMTDKEYEKKQDEIVNIYKPYFLKAIEKAKGGNKE